MLESAELQHVLVGTAGHIDHGKTRLVGMLSGIATDRLPEEKARGISIDLGFAHWEGGGFQFGVVDVPGHERFVKNMVAGATGVNLALLVVAADDSVMPQTREHLEIMDLLGVSAGVVAITKIDLVERDFVELVQAEIEELTAGTFLEGAPVVPVSSETGEGIEELKSALTRVAEQSHWADSHGLFRMPIDRVFSITGHGTVVTGSVQSGEVHAGDMLELLPQVREVRVRSVETHGELVDDSGARRRTAINLAGVKTDELARGMELATAGFLRPAHRMLVELRCLASSPLFLKDRLELSLHLGTAEAVARIVLKGEKLKPGQRGYAELRLREPLVAAYGQRFILRRISPALTVAGGTILEPFIAAERRIRDLAAYGNSMSAKLEFERLSYQLSQQDSVFSSPLAAAWRAGVHPERFAGLIEELNSAGELVRLGSGERSRVIHRRRRDGLANSVLKTVKEEIERNQPRKSLPRATLATACRGIARGDLFAAIFDFLLEQGRLVTVGDNIGPADAQVKLTKAQQQARDRILADVNAAKLSPPTRKELAAAVGMKPGDLERLLELTVEDGLLVKVSDDLHYSPAAIELARLKCRKHLAEAGEAAMSQLRETWGVSRKFAVPLCEFLDAIGVTTRKGDVRVAGPKIEVPLSNG